MLITVIQAEDAHEALLQIKSVADKADGFELRLDLWHTIDVEALKALRQQCVQPIIFTLRRQDQGGSFTGTEAERLQMILTLCQLAPDYFDLEYDVPREFVAQVHQQFPKINLIASRHDFDATPEDLPAFLATLEQPYIKVYKIATLAQSIVDALRMLVLIKNARVPVAGMCMGELGEITRVLGKIVGNVFDYACLDSAHATAPGQLTVQTLQDIYHYHLLNQETQIYGVFGDPVNKSVGYILHNQNIRLLQKDAVYVRLQVRVDEIGTALQWCRQLPFAGASVTMPLKEVIMQHLDQIEANAERIKAVNTLVIKDHVWQGFNTDGAGAIVALEAQGSLANKTIVILGAGGAAKAIAYVALKRGAQVILLNRTLARAEQLAQNLGCQAGDLSQLKTLKKYDALINTLPVGDDMAQLVQPQDLKKGVLAMDIVYRPLETTFLQIAKAAGCVCIPGYEMYINQALLQLQYWFLANDEMLKKIRTLMRSYFLNG